jgi:hypothetical protein
MKPRDQIAYLQSEVERLAAALAAAQVDLDHYDTIVSAHNALYDMLRDAGIEVYSTDGERWTVSVRGANQWTGYASPVEAARAGLLRLVPR